MLDDVASSVHQPLPPGLFFPALALINPGDEVGPGSWQVIARHAIEDLPFKILLNK